MQFCARFGFKMEAKSVELCAGVALYDISKARIFTEFEKLFAAKYQIYGLYYFFKLGVAQKLFGIHADFGKFLKMARELKKTYDFFEKPRQETFLYQLFSIFKINKNSFLDKIAAPNAYYKTFALQKRAPKNISDRFLIALSLKMPISLWLGAYKSGVKANAKRLGVWHEGYKPDITHQKMIATGFKNGEISKNYTLGLSKEIREKFRG
jgi:tRNA nucleotidyltransferase (CCA-adding enzyme)